MDFLCCYLRAFYWRQSPAVCGSVLIEQHQCVHFGKRSVWLLHPRKISPWTFRHRHAGDACQSETWDGKELEKLFFTFWKRLPKSHEIYMIQGLKLSVTLQEFGGLISTEISESVHESGSCQNWVKLNKTMVRLSQFWQINLHCKYTLLTFSYYLSCALSKKGLPFLYLN